MSPPEEAMTAFAECGERLVTKDSVINSANRDLARRIMALAGDEQTREAGLVSGEFREFTDAGHTGE